MAEGGGSKLLHAWYGHLGKYADVAEWTDGQDSDSHQKRSDIVVTIIRKNHTDHLTKILDSGWDVNEKLIMTNYKTGKRTCWTSVQLASWTGWTEAVKLLFDTEATYMTSGVFGAPLMLALCNYECSVELIDLLLKNGEDPNPTEKQLSSLPLGLAIVGIEFNKEFTKIVQLLLENGADTNITASSGRLYRDTQQCPLTEVLELIERMLYIKMSSDCYQNIIMIDMVNEVKKSNANLFQTLVRFGADVNWNVDETTPLLHTMVDTVVHTEIPAQANGLTSMYLQEHLDIFYQNRGNINVQNSSHGTALEYTVRECRSSNSVRWLIRHGANIHPTMFTLLEGHFIPNNRRCISKQQFEETLLILLHAGMRVPNQTYVYLTSIYNEFSMWQENALAQGGTDNSHTFPTRVKDLWSKLLHEGKEHLAKLDNKFKKHTFSEYLSTQMVDLEEFSDESLIVDPEIIPEKWQNKDKLTFALDQIQTVLEFLSQPQSLLWHCRRCVRENLVSLQPSVVRPLPGPAKLKRLILCHEI